MTLCEVIKDTKYLEGKKNEFLKKIILQILLPS